MLRNVPGTSQPGSRAGHFCYVIPDVQVLRGTIQSMFHIYETSIHSTLREGAYFHDVQVSFPSNAKKLKWMRDATVELERRQPITVTAPDGAPGAI
jgi:hypothetical protein